MGTVAHYLEVSAPADKAYAWWRGLTNLPSVMPDVESVTAGGPDGTTTHWKVHGPLGKTVEWDASIVGDNTVATAGAVRFDDHGTTTGVEVALTYDPPAGAVGEAVAKLFADPQDKVEAAVRAFKEQIEAAA